MHKLARYRQKKKGKKILLYIVLLAIIVIGIWLGQKSLQKQQKQPVQQAQEEILSPADTLSLPDTRPNERETAQKTLKTEAKQINQYPAEAFPGTKKARMIDSGLYILIVKNRHELNLYEDGKIIKTYRVGLGKYPEDKAAVGDMRTPEGHFYINFIRDSRDWTHDFKDGKGETKGAYGPWFMALYTGKQNTFSGKTWTGIGIHGTHDPATIGKNDSESCIRMYNNEVSELRAIICENQYVAVDIVAAL